MCVGYIHVAMVVQHRFQWGSLVNTILIEYIYVALRTITYYKIVLAVHYSING
jgi:hypothetical protein